MGLDGLMSAARQAAGERAWGAAVELARGGAVVGVSDDGEEVCLRVKSRRRPVPCEVYLWPDDADWGCDCELPGDVCVHVLAAVISLQRSRKAGKELPSPQKTYAVKLRYALTTAGQGLSVARRILWPSGKETPLEGALAESDVLATSADAAVETLLALHPGGALSAEHLRRFLSLLGGDALATLDGAEVQLSAEPVLFRVRVTDDGSGEGAGFRLGLYRPREIDQLYRGAARIGDVLHPTSHGKLVPEQRRMLIRGVTFTPDEVGALVSETLPRLRQRVPVDVETNRLPTPETLVPQVLLSLSEKPGGLELLSEVVYGDPPVARITKAGTLERLSTAVIPARDLSAERAATRTFEESTGLPVGYKRLLPPDRAAAFLRDTLPHHTGQVRGRVDPQRFRVATHELRPHLDVREVPPTGAKGDGGWALDVRFDGEGRGADPLQVLRAWRSGQSLVPLLDGGYSPLPMEWLKQHGSLLRELLEARDRDGRVDRNATAALVELLEDTDAEVPPDLSRLRTFLEGGEGLPEEAPPEGLRADLRPYQLTGYRWLLFLREMSLSGILADDMGLGKTVQALAALHATPGRHLVVAPTSVLRNWEREAARFVPDMSVSVYHGPQRRLDPEVDVTLTSYALLRIDLARLRDVDWTYVCLDEAQGIKNSTSQTARAAFALRARHRLALTGTPVENRLEELWSLFRFLMPGLLGGLDAFRERFARPIELGSAPARRALRARVRPYVLRRLKQQVASELPPLTDVVVRCTLGAGQRAVYDAVRMAARRDVQEALSERGRGGATMQVLEALLRLRQACCDPAMLPGDMGSGVASAKLERLEELLVDLICDDHKALVFSQWTTLLDLVEDRLEPLGIPWVRLDGSTRDRQAVIDRFQDAAGPPVFLLSLKAGGMGLNLTAADYVLHLDPWWNPAVQQQATDRAHRIGQDKPVVSCRLIAEDTVEERILELQDAKRGLAEAALGSEGGLVRALSADELRALFEAG